MIYWAVLMERTLSEQAVQALLDIAQSAPLESERIGVPYCRTDEARNMLTQLFLKKAQGDDDRLIMLDCDHIHPPDVLARLAAHDVDVVGALYFRRVAVDSPSEPTPLLWRIGQNGYEFMHDYPKGQLVECDGVATGAICIKRKVFRMIEEKVEPYPFFRYNYRNGLDQFPTEDVDFSARVTQAGAKIFCDTSLVTKHIVWAWLDENTWTRYQASAEKIKEQLNG